jgi:hypothetical protein
MKYIAVAKYVDPEPSHGSWGSEETQITLIVHSPLQGYNYNGSFLVNITASSGGAPIDKIWFNVKNGTDWVYSQNQTYTAPITKTGYAKGFYSFYAWANNTFATVGVNFTFSSQIETLRANGSKILDKYNNIVLLRGVNKVEFADDPDGIWMGSTYWDDNNVKAELDAMKSWGVNVVRCHLSVELWKYDVGPNSGHPASPYCSISARDAIKRFINMAAERGIYVILGGYTVRSWFTGGEQDSMPFPPYQKSTNASDVIASIDEFVDWWRSIAGELKDYPNVLFELWNEPDGDFNDWMNASQRCINAIREEGATQIIIISWKSGVYCALY